MEYNVVFVTLGMILASIHAYPSVAVGCYYDTRYFRTLNGDANKDMRPNGKDNCSDFCVKKGYRYAGTEYSYECFCGNTIRTKERSSGCYYKCASNRNEVCGGSNSISIYDNLHCAKQPCKNGGTCTDIDAIRYRCFCPEKWTGSNCEQEVTTTTTTSTTTTTTLTTTITDKPTTDFVDTTETMLDANMASSTSFTEEQTDLDGQTVVITYASVACGVVAMVITVIVVLFICRRRKTKRRENGKMALRNLEPTNKTVNDGANNISFISADSPSRRTTLYSNEHVSMTADGEHVNIEFYGTDSRPSDCDDYNTLRLSGTSAAKCSDRNARAIKRANQVDSTYSRLCEHNTDHSPSDTYSRIARNRQNNISHLCDSTYSHIGQGVTQSMINEKVTPPEGMYNTLNTLPRTQDRRNNLSNFKAIGYDNEDQVYSNVLTADPGKELSELDDNYSHIKQVKADQIGPRKEIFPFSYNSKAEDNVYANVVKKINNTQYCEKVEVADKQVDQNKHRYYISEKLDKNIQECDNDNDDNTYYNVCLTNEKE